MSFTSSIKDEISKLDMTKLENISELSGFVRTNGTVTEDKIELISENSNVARRVYNFFKSIYGINSKIETKKNNTFNKNNIYEIIVNEKIDEILNDLSVTDASNTFLDVPKEYIYESDDEKKAYIRGVFLSGGSINDPRTSRYHLEILLDEKYESVFVQRLLNHFNLNSKILMRDNKYMVYIKDSEKISDFLRIINATNAVLYYENVKIIREQKNMTNRLNNCEQANTEKVMQAGGNQTKDIHIIEDELGLDFLDDKLKEACVYRLKYPEASLTELSEIITLETGNTITKSGLNHRFRKIKEIAKKIYESRKN